MTRVKFITTEVVQLYILYSGKKFNKRKTSLLHKSFKKRGV